MKSGLFFSAVFISGALAAPVVELESDAALSVSKRQTNFLSLVEKFFPADVSLNNTSTAETKLISTAGTALAKAAGITTSENDVGTGAACSDMTIIFARGTTEPGTVGVLAGPPFFDAVKAQLGSSATLSVQGVDYPADIPGFLEGGDKAGSQTMANDVSAALAACPDTKLVMAGYSQGGQLVHNAAKLLPAATMAKVNSVVIFGDPDNGAAVTGVSAAQTNVICHAGDNICQHGDLILLPHLTYSQDATTAAQFVVAAAS